MNVEIGTEAAQFPEKEYMNGIFVSVPLPHPPPSTHRTNTYCKPVNRPLSQLTPPSVVVPHFTHLSALMLLSLKVESPVTVLSSKAAFTSIGGFVRWKSTLNNQEQVM